MTAKFSFNNPPLENIAFLMSKKPELHFDYDEIKFEAHQRAFTVAKLRKLIYLQTYKQALKMPLLRGKVLKNGKKN